MELEELKSNLTHGIERSMEYLEDGKDYFKDIHGDFNEHFGEHLQEVKDRVKEAENHV